MFISVGQPATSPSPRGSNNARPGIEYAGGCPSQSTASWALARPVVLLSAKLNGLEYDCAYSEPGRARVEIGYLYSAHATPASLLTSLERYTEPSQLTSVPGIGLAAYKQTTPDGSTMIVAISHSFTITLLASGSSVQADERFLKTAVVMRSG